MAVRSQQVGLAPERRPVIKLNQTKPRARQQSFCSKSLGAGSLMTWWPPRGRYYRWMLLVSVGICNEIKYYKKSRPVNNRTKQFISGEHTAFAPSLLSHKWLQTITQIFFLFPSRAALYKIGWCKKARMISFLLIGLSGSLFPVSLCIPMYP